MIESIERMHKLVEDNLVMGLRFQMHRELDNLEKEIIAMLDNRECKNVAPDYLDFLCNACGFVHYHSDENDTGDGNDWAYCPRCGKAVKR